MKSTGSGQAGACRGDRFLRRKDPAKASPLIPSTFFILRRFLILVNITVEADKAPWRIGPLKGYDFEVREAKSGALIRILQGHLALYQIIIEYPTSEEALARSLAPKVMESFAVAGPVFFQTESLPAVRQDHRR